MSRITASFAAVAALALSIPTFAAAQQGAPEGPPRGPALAFVGEFTLEFGGEPVAETLFEDGSTQTMPAGQGATAAVGGEIRPSHGSPLALRATVGAKYITTKATNAHINLLRFPVELVGSYTVANDVRVGAGYVRHTGIRLDGGGIGDDREFSDAQGPTVELGWRWIALSYTMLQYVDGDGNEYDASNAGLSFVWTFGGR